MPASTLNSIPSLIYGLIGQWIMSHATPMPLPKAEQFYSDVSKIGSRDKKSAWYNTEFLGAPSDIRHLLETHAGIAPEQVDSHVLYIVSNVPWQCFH